MVTHTADLAEPDVAAQIFLDATLDALNANIAILDSRGTVIKVNAGWRNYARNNGAPEGEVYVGYNYLEVCRAVTGGYGTYPSSVADGIQQVIDGRLDEFYLEYPCHSEFKKEWYALRATPFQEPAPRRVMVANASVTERVLAEQREEAARVRLATVLNTLVDAALSLSLPDLTVIYLSNSYEKVYGYRAEHLLANPDFYRQVIHPVDLELLDSANELAFAQGHSMVEFRIFTPQGTLRWIQKKIWVTKENGVAIRMDEVSADITERKAMQDSLQRSEETYRSLIDSSDAAISMVAPNGTYLFANVVAARPFKISPEELIGRNVRNLFLDSDATSILRDIRSVLERNEGMVLETSVMLGGKQEWYRSSIQPIRDEMNQPYAVMIHASNITEIKTSHLALERYAHRLQGLHSIDRAILASQTLEELANRSLDHLRLLIPYPRASVLSLNLPQHTLRLIASRSDQNLPFDSNEVYAIHPETVERFKHQPSLLITDLQAAPLESIRLLYGSGVRSILAIALRAEDEIIGGLILLSEDTAFFTEEYVSIANEVADAMAIAMHTTLLNTRVRAYTSELETHIADRTRELQQSMTELEAILSGSSDAIVLLDVVYGIQRANPAFYQLFGVQAEAVPGQLLSVLIAADDLEMVDSMVRDALTGEMTQRIEVRAYHTDGSLFTMELAMAGVRLPHTPVTNLVCLMRDVTERKARERQLRYHASLQDNVHDAVIATDLHFNIQSWNRAAERMYGWTAAEMTGTYGFNIIPSMSTNPEARSRAISNFMRDGFWQGEMLHVRKDGSTFSVLGTVSLLRDKAGVIFGVVAVNVDITQRKQAEEELQRNQADMRSVLNNTSQAFMLMDADGIIRILNNLAQRYFRDSFGIEIEVGKPMLDYIPPEGHALFRQRFEHVMSGRNLSFDLKATINETPRDFYFEYFPVKSPSGEILGINVSFENVTERKAMERQLRYHASLQENVADAVIATDLDFKIQSWNRAAERIYGWRQEEVLGKPMKMLLNTEFASKETVEKVEAEFLQRGYWTNEVIQHHRDGTPIHILSSVVLFRDETGQSFGVVAVNHDITQRKIAEMALQAALAREKELNELKTRFVSMASHEFRTPLATILALTETLKAYWQRLENDQIQERLEKIGEQVGHLKDVMEDVLLLARMQARRVEFNPVLMDVDDLIETVLEEFQNRQDVFHTLQYTASPSPVRALLDKKLMRQILSNLIANAIKYSPSDQPIQLALTQDADTLVMTIRDGGIGIPQSDLNHLFEPFHRGSNVSTISGTGLGLVIAKEGVELHGGTITVASVLNAGTTFTIVLPIKRQETGL